MPITIYRDDIDIAYVYIERLFSILYIDIDINDTDIVYVYMYVYIYIYGERERRVVLPYY